MVGVVKIGGSLMKKILAGVVLFAAGIACGLILAYGPLHAQEPVQQEPINEGNIMAKLGEISKGQEEVIAAVNSMKEDIRIIKIRVTQSQ
jgi:hypothetical protein